MTQAELDLAAAPPPAAGALACWAPADWPVAPDWQPVLAPFWAGAAGRQLGRFIAERLAAGATIYPREPLRALALTPLAQVRVVILGQDPYHGPGQAEGLAFSVPAGVPPPPSLRNIFQELARDPVTAADAGARSGTLEPWARQGVLLLNTCLTVEAGRPAAHAGRGWETLTDQILLALARAGRPVVFMLWGGHAQKKRPLLEVAAGPRLLLCANHPSPLSARRPPEPFIGCGHFGRANDFLRQQGMTPVRW